MKLSRFFPLLPEQAANLSPEDLHFPMDEFLVQFGLTPEEARAELQAGALVAEGEEIVRHGALIGYSEVSVTLAAVFAWLETGRPAARKAMAYITSRPSA